MTRLDLICWSSCRYFLQKKVEIYRDFVVVFNKTVSSLAFIGCEMTIAKSYSTNFLGRRKRLNKLVALF